ACGNGAYAIALAQADPSRHVVAVDYAEDNIAAGRAAAAAMGVGDRITWHCAPVWDFTTGAASAWCEALIADYGPSFDGVWCGEFLEHIADYRGLIRVLESLCAEN